MRFAMSLLASPAKSAETGFLEIVVSLDDGAQLVLRGAVAAIGIGMMAFYQLLEARLDVVGARAFFEPERMQRLALGVAHGAPLGLGARTCGTGSGATELPQDVEGIVGDEALLKSPAGPSLGTPLAADHADPPCRQVTGERVLLIARDRVIAHAGEKIIGLIVLAHVVEAEPPVFALAVASLGRPVGRRLDAIGPLTARLFRTQPA